VGGHFDAVGFGNPDLGFEATREYLRTCVSAGQLVARTDDFSYYELETAEGCGLAAVTDDAGYLLNGCPYFRGQRRHRLRLTEFVAWDEGEPYQGGARGELLDGQGAPVEEILVALTRFAAERATRPPGVYSISVVGLGYFAMTQANDRTLPPGFRPLTYFRPSSSAAGLAPLRRCNVECRGRIEQASLLVNALSGTRLAYAVVNCGSLQLEVVIDLPSLTGGLAVGAFLEGSFWLVGRIFDETEATPAPA
jgi:hypothetical protein